MSPLLVVVSIVLVDLLGFSLVMPLLPRFGVGFVLGPLLGGLLVALPIAPEWRLRLPFLVAAGFSMVAWVLVVFRLPESLPADAQARQRARVLSWRGLVDVVSDPRIGLLV